ncbi:hypothetical protein GRI43_06390 [Altererythrobacter luteolus]|uniref:Uncharacterized protein n=1 Tax=Pontixanthobacter luteolus TaxID=295089 RepID=A0A6I4UZW8_9SPHN|nr:hypothetical protein [Pontixanthobacter luteolus]MXP47015.1 hypothetical protein [Pontixanthobacter luteolus]
MSKYSTRELVADKAIVREEIAISAPAVPEADRSFNLPTGLYVATAGSYFAFLGIMSVGFSTPGLILPIGIMVVLLTAFFGIATIFVRTDPAARAKIMRLGQLRSRGVMTHTGRLSMKDVAIQMLILPVLIVMWGLTVVTIAALV